MRVRTVFFGVLVAAAAVSSAFAAVDEHAAAARLPHGDLSAEQIVNRNVAARGGLQAWRGVRSLAMSGKMDAGKTHNDPGKRIELSHSKRSEDRRARIEAARSDTEGGQVIQLPIRLELKRPHMSRLEVTFKNEAAVQTFDGRNGWKLRPYTGRHEVEPLTVAELKAVSHQDELDGALIDYAAKGSRVELEGMDKVDGRNAYKLKLTGKDGDVRQLWVDAKTYLDVQIAAAPQHIGGKLRQVTTRLRDYRSVDGLMIPFVLETAVEGTSNVEKIAFDKVALNPPLDNQRFAKPR
jgi:outer membrane lipoprotein-sorting protein